MKDARFPLSHAVFLVGCALVLISAFGPLIYLYFHAPEATQYRFADGFLPDYYHYLMKIKSGMMGYLGYYHRYSQTPTPVSFGHAIFPLMGFVSSMFGLLRTDVVYLLSRIVTLIGLFIVWFIVTRIIFPSGLVRILVHVLFFTSTGLYTFSKSAHGIVSVDPIVFSGFYNALQKFPAPPQHLVASTLLLVVSLFLVTPVRRSSLIIVGICAFVIGMTQPLISAIGFLSLWGMSVLTRKYLPVTIAYSIGTIVPQAYYAYLFSHVEPWTIWAQTTFSFNYRVSFWGYVMANGMFLPFVLLLIGFVRRMPPVFVMYTLWGIILPTILFPLAYYGKVFSLPRLLQLQQYIPLTLVSGFVLAHIFSRLTLKKRGMSVVILSVCCIVYAFLPWKTAIDNAFLWKPFHYYNVFIPNDFIDALTFLESTSPRESVVLTGEYMSATIPAFTHNRVILGRGDVVGDYEQKLAGMYMVFGVNLKEAAVRSFLSRHSIDYVIFGVDTPVFAQPYTSMSFLQPVFTKGNVTVVKVKDEAIAE